MAAQGGTELSDQLLGMKSKIRTSLQACDSRSGISGGVRRNAIDCELPIVGIMVLIIPPRELDRVGGCAAKLGYLAHLYQVTGVYQGGVLRRQVIAKRCQGGVALGKVFEELITTHFQFWRKRTYTEWGGGWARGSSRLRELEYKKSVCVGFAQMYF